MQIQASRKDRLWSIAGIVLSMSANLVLLPAILHFLDDDMVGLYYVFSSLGAITGLFDFGFSPSVARSIAYAWSGASELAACGAGSADPGKPNFVLMKRIIRTCKYIYLLISSSALLVSLSIGTVYISSITKSISGYTPYLAWVLYALAIFLNLLFGYYTVCLRGVGAVADANKAMVFSRCAQIALSLILLSAGAGLAGVAIAYLGYGILYRLIAKRSFYRYRGIGRQLNAVTLAKSEYRIGKILRAIWPNTWRDGLVTLSLYLMNQATTIIASLFLTLSQTGTYSLCVQLAAAVSTISGAFLNAYLPTMQSAFANRDVQKQRQVLSLVVFTYIAMETIGTALVLLLGIPFVRWIKPTYAISASVLFFVSVCQFLLKLVNCYTTYISTTNRLIYSGSFVVTSLACVLLCFALAGWCQMGLAGLLIAQILSQAAYCAWKWPLFVHCELELSVRHMFQLGWAQFAALLKKKNDFG